MDLPLTGLGIAIICSTIFLSFSKYDSSKNDTTITNARGVIRILFQTFMFTVLPILAGTIITVIGTTIFSLPN